MQSFLAYIFVIALLVPMGNLSKSYLQYNNICGINRLRLACIALLRESDLSILPSYLLLTHKLPLVTIMVTFRRLLASQGGRSRLAGAGYAIYLKRAGLLPATDSYP